MTEAESYYYDLCDKHEWAGVGECPSCKGERLADESVDRILTEKGNAPD